MTRFTISFPHPGHNSYGIEVWSDVPDLIEQIRDYGMVHLLYTDQDHPNRELGAFLQGDSEEWLYFEFLGADPNRAGVQDLIWSAALAMAEHFGLGMELGCLS